MSSDSSAASLGIGVAARSTIASLVRCGVPTVAVDVQLPGDRSGADTTWTHLCLPDPVSSGMPHQVNLIHMNPVEAASFWNNYPSFFENTYNIIVPFAKLRYHCHYWVPCSRTTTLVLAASAYIEAAITKISSAPVRMYRLGIEGSHRAPSNGRARFGLASGRLHLRDELRHRQRREPARTLLPLSAHLTSRSQDEIGRAACRETQRAARARPRGPPCSTVSASSARYRVVEQYLPYSEVIGLYNACDAYVSLHRSEGLGLDHGGVSTWQARDRDRMVRQYGFMDESTRVR